MRPALLVAQTGLLGGAERVLLDWAAALERPALLACPPGPLADAAGAAGLELLALPERSLRRRGRTRRAALDLAGLARDARRLVARRRARRSSSRPARARSSPPPAAPLGRGAAASRCTTTCRPDAVLGARAARRARRARPRPSATSHARSRARRAARDA